MASKTRKTRARGAATNRTAAPRPAVRIPRIAKGRKPQYFSDPAIDKLLWMTVSLMEELSVTRDRLDAVERLLERRRTLSRRDIDNFRAEGAARAERDANRAAFVDRVLRTVQAELEEVSRQDMPRTAEEAVAAVAS